MAARIHAVCIAVAILLFAGSGFAADGDQEVKALIEKLKDKDKGVRLKAAKDLGKLKEKAKAAIPALTAALKDSDEDVRAVAKKSLDSIKDGLGDEEKANVNEKIQPLIKDLKSKDNKVRLSAIEQLAEMGADAKPAGGALVEFGMMHTSTKVREAASAAMEKIDATVYKEILKILIDENEYVKMAAIRNLSSMGKSANAAVPAIKGFLTTLNGPTPKGRPRSDFNQPHSHFGIIQAMASIVPEDEYVLTMVVNAVKAPDNAIRSPGGITFRNEAISLMHTLKMDNKRKYNALMSGLSATKVDRAMVIKEIGKLGIDAKAAIPTLTKLKLDPELNVREAATSAINAIND